MGIGTKRLNPSYEVLEVGSIEHRSLTEGIER